MSARSRCPLAPLAQLVGEAREGGGQGRHQAEHEPDDGSAGVERRRRRRRRRRSMRATCSGDRFCSPAPLLDQASRPAAGEHASAADARRRGWPRTIEVGHEQGDDQTAARPIPSPHQRPPDELEEASEARSAAGRAPPTPRSPRSRGARPASGTPSGRRDRGHPIVVVLAAFRDRYGYDRGCCGRPIR